ncbi:MAG: hypothetical protein F4X76_01915 [Chloroflexi bacterium]|nr:hypothetical protein [Chloroflexota bacterium]
MSSEGGWRRPRGRVRLLAVAIDAASLLVLLLGGLAVAFVWLLIRSSAGRYDAGTGDTLIAATLIGAIAPAWTAWQATRLYRLGATFGQARLGLAVEGARWRRALRLLLHPISLLLWGWLLITLLLAGAPPLWLLLTLVNSAAVIFLLWVGALLVSVARGSEWRHGRLPHDWLARTRLVQRS